MFPAPNIFNPKKYFEINSMKTLTENGLWQTLIARFPHYLIWMRLELPSSPGWSFGRVIFNTPLSNSASMRS